MAAILATGPTGEIGCSGDLGGFDGFGGGSDGGFDGGFGGGFGGMG